MPYGTSPGGGPRLVPAKQLHRQAMGALAAVSAVRRAAWGARGSGGWVRVRAPRQRCAGAMLPLFCHGARRPALLTIQHCLLVPAPPLPHGAHCQVVLVAAVGLMHSGSKIGLLQAEPARMAFVNGE